MPDRYESLSLAPVIITGGTRGLGRAIAGGFAAAGALVVITGRDHDKCVAAASELSSATSGTVVGRAVHAGDHEAMAALAAWTADLHGGISVVVNNAAVSLGSPVSTLSIAMMQKSLDVNLIGPLALVQASLPWLQASGQGSVINILTSGLRRPVKGLSAYLASKGALEVLTRTMALEFAELGVRANSISPGGFDTDMVRGMDEAARDARLRMVPLGRIAHPADVVDAALFLGSAASGFVTGHTLVVDGGMTI